MFISCYYGMNGGLLFLFWFCQRYLFTYMWVDCLGTCFVDGHLLFLYKFLPMQSLSYGMFISCYYGMNGESVFLF